MARNLQINDTIYLPVSTFEEDPAATNNSFPIVEKTVLSIRQRKVEIDVGNGQTKFVASSKCHKNIGILICSIGDLQSELSLIDPLAKSILQFFRLLVPDDSLKSFKVRSLAELTAICQENHRLISHIIIIGHGDASGLKFGVGGFINVHEFSTELQQIGMSPKNIISLACQTGYKSFGGLLSGFTFCDHFIGPFQSVHGSVASQFVQTLFTLHFLDGLTLHVAFKKSRKLLTGSTSFRLWKKKELVAGPK